MTMQNRGKLSSTPMGSATLGMAVLVLGATLGSSRTVRAEEPPAVFRTGELGRPAWDGRDAASAEAWRGIYLKPSISYDTLSFKNTQLEDAEGLTVGAVAGFDVKRGRVFAGPFAGVTYDSVTGGFEGDRDVYKTRLRYDGVVGARAGVALGKFLVFASGGYAFADLRLRTALTGVSDSRTLSGWAAGLGAERRLTARNSLRLGFQYVRFDKDDLRFLPGRPGGGGVEASIGKLDVGIVHRF